MIDRETICRRLHALESYCVELERLAQTLDRADFDRDLSRQWTVEHGLQLAIEAVLDIGNHLIAAAGGPPPDSYREVIESLGKLQIVPAAFVENAEGMAGFRNVLVHDYVAVDLDVVWEMLQTGTSQFRVFIAAIVAYLKAQPPS